MSEHPVHDHNHDHHRHHRTIGSLEEATTMLRYAVGHNKDHTAELDELSELCSNEAADLICEAKFLFEQGNAKLQAALEIMEA